MFPSFLEMVQVQWSCQGVKIMEKAFYPPICILKENMRKNWPLSDRRPADGYTIMRENDEEDTSYYPYMNGNFVFKHAVTRFSEAIVEALQTNGYQPEDISLLIPHQANLRISQFIQKKMGLKDDQVYNNIMRFGNTTAASIPIALSEALQKSRIKEGDLVCMAAFGSGFTWASALIKW